QAEDGIRDPLVTGVQTCALPISIRVSEAIRVRLNPQFKGEKTIRYEFEIIQDATSDRIAEGYVTVVCVDASEFKATPIPEAIRRSEERRVGKECSWGGGAYLRAE